MPLYVSRGQCNSLYLSSESAESESWPTNHVEIQEAGHGRQGVTYEGLRNIITNILRNADVPFIEE